MQKRITIEYRGVWINGMPVDRFEMTETAAAFLRAQADPLDMNQKQAALFCNVDVKTFVKWKVPKNKNGRYSVAMLKERMTGSYKLPEFETREALAAFVRIVASGHNGGPTLPM